MLYFCHREYSKQLNESRIKVLQAQEDALQGILKDAEAGLARVSKDKKKYKALLTDLIVQVRMTTGISLCQFAVKTLLDPLGDAWHAGCVQAEGVIGVGALATGLFLCSS